MDPAENVSRARTLFLLFVLIPIFVWSSPFQAPPDPEPFTDSRGRVGLRTSTGEILIPASYDALGWSDGTFSLAGTTTGYKSNGLWGLINLKNQKITKAEFTDLSPANGQAIVARKKLPNQVWVASGVIDVNGKELVPFVYDGISITSFRGIVYNKSPRGFKHGLIDLTGNVLIPVQYLSIFPIGSLRYAVTDFNQKIAVFDENGNALTGFDIDSISTFQQGYAKIYREQHVGLLDREGNIKAETKYAALKIENNTFLGKLPDTWYFLDESFKASSELQADSLIKVSDHTLKAYEAGYYQLLNRDLKPISLKSKWIGNFSNGIALFGEKNQLGAIREDGHVVLANKYQNIRIDGDYFIATSTLENNVKWILLDKSQKRVGNRFYDDILPFNGAFFPVRNKKHWGGLDKNGNEIVACVHDSIFHVVGDKISLRFKGKYGVMSTREEWIIAPQPWPIQIITDSHFLEKRDSISYLKTFSGQTIYFTSRKMIYDMPNVRLEGSDGHVKWISLEGLEVNPTIKLATATPLSVTKASINVNVFEEREGLRGIFRDGKFGFVDSRGRLRIANRYDSIQSFHDGYAAVKIRGRWGYINASDQIVIQPQFEWVGQFEKGRAIVKQKNFFGVIDLKGKFILPPRYETLSFSEGGRYYIRQNGLHGILDAQGRIIVQPKYHRLQDLNNGYFIAGKDDYYGLLNGDGLNVVPMIYQQLDYDAVSKRYIGLIRGEWERLKTN